jgi:uncharacterized protein
MNKSMSLFLLQNIDLQIDGFQNRMNQINHQIDDHTEVDLVVHEMETNQGLGEVHARRLAEVEKKLSTTRIKLQQSEASLYGGKIHNPKELQDLQAEIQSLKPVISHLEEDQFGIMLEMEENAGLSTKMKQQIEKLGTDHTGLVEVLTRELNEINHQMERLQSERKALIASIDETSLQTYSTLRKTKSGIAVTQVDDNTCDKCGAEITQAVWQKARISNDLCFCSTCGRIIYAK